MDFSGFNIFSCDKNIGRNRPGSRERHPSIYEEEIYVDQDAPPIQQQPTEQNSDISLNDDHSATLKIFNSSKNSHQSGSNSDRENHELQLKAAHKPRKKKQRNSFKERW